MKSDVVVIGAELESMVAALRIAERGAHVRLLMPGAGSLHYSAGGLSVLNTGDNRSPFSAIPQLGKQHPYSLLGQDLVKAAIDWFLQWLDDHSTPWSCETHNVAALTMIGRSASVFAFPPSLATFSLLNGRRLAVVGLDEHQDFFPDLCAAGLIKLGIDATVVRVAAPSSGDSVRIARALDDDSGSFFETVRQALRPGIDAVIFPAVLGLKSPETVFRTATERIQADVFEVATLPPSVFGLRLYQLLVNSLRIAGVDIHPDIRGLRARFSNGSCLSLCDEKGQEYRATSFIVANGGVLLGGLDVDSYGKIHEPICGLDVIQTGPLTVVDPTLVSEALHQTGVVTDEYLRPFKDGRTVKNVHAVGTLLPHWNPIQELSCEGVAVASGMAAADFALGDIRQ